jgi:hypothetical protein
MKQFKYFYEMLGHVDSEISQELMAAIADDETAQLKSFEEVYGGDVFVIEKPDDIGEVFAINSNGDTVDIRSKVANFDAAHYLPSKNWIFLFTAGTDHGGNSYFVPSMIGNRYATLVESVHLANNNLSVVRSFRGPLMKVTRVSPASGVCHELLLPITRDQYMSHVNGALVQDAFKQLTQSEREFIQTGITEDEWNLIFADSEE